MSHPVPEQPPVLVGTIGVFDPGGHGALVLRAPSGQSMGSVKLYAWSDGIVTWKAER